MKVPVLKVSSLTYRDTWRVCQVMPALLGIALLVCLTEAVVTDKFSQGSAPLVLVTNLIGSLVATCLIAPVLIAVYRFILIDDRSGEYRIDFQDLRFRKFVAYSTALVLIFHVGLLGDVLFDAGSGASMLLLLLVWLGLLLLSIKLMLLFPAIAIDVRSADWANAMRASGGNFWRFVGICIIVSLPILPFAMLSTIIESLREPAAAKEGLSALAGEMLIGVVNFITQLMLAVAASQLFMLLGDKMRSGPDAASPAGGA